MILVPEFSDQPSHQTNPAAEKTGGVQEETEPAEWDEKRPSCARDSGWIPSGRECPWRFNAVMLFTTSVEAPWRPWPWQFYIVLNR